MYMGPYDGNPKIKEMAVNFVDLGHNDMMVTMRRDSVFHEEQLVEFEPGMNLPYAACVSVHTTVICIRGLPGVFLYRLNQRARVEACEGFAILSHVHIRVLSDRRAIAYILTDASVTARSGVAGRHADAPPTCRTAGAHSSDVAEHVTVHAHVGLSSRTPDDVFQIACPESKQSLASKTIVQPKAPAV